MRIRGIRFAAIGALLSGISMQTYGATITVTNTNDSGPGSLRQALANASNGDGINFAVTGTITLTSGGLSIVKNVTISGPGANQLAVDGDQATLVFGVAPQRTVSISSLSIKNAEYGISNNHRTVSVSNCVLSGTSVAGLYNYAGDGPDVGASMTVANSIISNNSGRGAYNVYPFLINGGNGGSCACMTIRHSFIGYNAEGIFNFCNDFRGTASLTVVNSNVSLNDGAGIRQDAGESGAAATIVSTTVSGNSAGGVLNSGGMFSASAFIITNSTISGNSSADSGGGISNFAFVSIDNSTISANSSVNSGGGIYAIGQVSVENSTISGNSAGTSGGGIYNFLSPLHVANSTISGNSAVDAGGGIWNSRATVQIANSTISGNSAGSGGGVYNVQDQGAATIETGNTILNAGALGENIVNDGGTVTSDGYNLSSDDGGGYLTGPGDQINTDPMLGPLQDNGGPTFTHALLQRSRVQRSPAIDAGDPSFTPPPNYDQRGSPFGRVFNGHIDIGSFELRYPTPHPRPTPP